MLEKLLKKYFENNNKDELNLTLYKYTGIKNGDEKTKGVLVAENKPQLIKMLEKRGITATKIEPTPSWLLKFMSANNIEIALFFNGMTKMLEAGLGIETAIELLLKENFSPSITMFLFQLKQNISEGNSLPDSVKKTNFFPKDIVEMIRVGNEAGKIIDVFTNLKDYYEQQQKIKKAVRGALMMPSIIVVATMFIIVFLAPKMIKPMVAIFDKIDPSKFPVLTTYTLNFVNFMASNIIYIIFIIISIVWFYKKTYRTNLKFKYKMDEIYLNLPIIGQFIKKLSTYKFFMTISILYDAGIPINSGFEMIAKSQQNDIIKEDFTKAKDNINKGYNLTKSIQKSPFISDLAKSLISIGEETGRLSEQLKNLKEISKRDFEEYSETIKKAMTPISTIVIGGVIGVLVVAVYLPIMSMVELMGSN